MGFSQSLIRYENTLSSLKVTEESGKVTEVQGFVIKGYLPGASIGGICEVFPLGKDKGFSCEVVGFKDHHVLLMPLGDMKGIGLGSKIVLLKKHASVKVGKELLGRVLNGLGQPIDNKGSVGFTEEVPLQREICNPMEREPIHEPLDLGIRAINGLLTAGKGQRVGIMAGSGVGKSVLLGMIAQGTEADVNVIALIGERGRELREFIENDLGEEGLKRSVVICATSDQNPLVRMRGAFTATSIAEYFAAQGKSVLLMMDSVTRFAMAQREVGLSIGEPPASKGYTPSVFSTLPKLLERAGSFSNGGSITGLYSVLVEGDDMDDPIGDTVRSIVDGHIVLDRRLAQKGHFPAIDILQSASRVMRQCVEDQHNELAQSFRELLARYREAEDLINIGAYNQGADARVDRAIEIYEPMNLFLRQKIGEKTSFDETLGILSSVLLS